MFCSVFLLFFHRWNIIVYVDLESIKFKIKNQTYEQKSYNISFDWRIFIGKWSFLSFTTRAFSKLTFWTKQLISSFYHAVWSRFNIQSLGISGSSIMVEIFLWNVNFSSSRNCWLLLRPYQLCLFSLSTSLIPKHVLPNHQSTQYDHHISSTMKVILP